LNDNVANRAIEWIEVYLTAFNKLEKMKNDDFFISWIGRDIFQSVYLARAREHLVDILTTLLKQTDTDEDLIKKEEQNALDFRQAMFEMWYRVSSKVHVLIPEAKLNEKTSNLVSETVRAYMECEMNKLKRSLIYRISSLAKSNLSNVKNEPEINDMISKVGNSILEDIEIATLHIATLINPEDTKFQALENRKQVFHTWIQSSVMKVFEDVCTFMEDQVMSHSQFEIHVGKEAEEASKLPEHKRNKVTAVTSRKNYQSNTPTGLLLVSRLFRDLCKDYLKRIKASLEKQFPTKTKAFLFDIGHLEYCLKNCAQHYILVYIETQGQRLDKVIRIGIESHDWLNDSGVVRGVRFGIVSVVKDMSEIADFVNKVFPMKNAITERKKRNNETSSFPFASIDNANGQQHEIVKDVMKIFNKDASAFRIKSPVLDNNLDINPGKILVEIMKISLKTFNECVRMCTFGKDGFQQLQVDAHFLKITWSKLVDDEKVIISMINEVMNSCAERCLELSPLDQNIIQTLVDKKVEQLQ